MRRYGGTHISSFSDRPSVPQYIISSNAVQSLVHNNRLVAEVARDGMHHNRHVETR